MIILTPKEVERIARMVIGEIIAILPRGEELIALVRHPSGALDRGSIGWCEDGITVIPG